MYMKLISLMAAAVFFTGAAIAQTPDAMRELLSLNQLLAQSPDLNFNIAYYYEEDDSSGIGRDTMTGTASVSHNKSYMRLNGLKKINNEYFNAIIDTVNQEIYVSDPEPAVQHIMNAQFTSASFMNYYVDTAVITDSSGYRIISISFKEAAPFNWYKVCYSISGRKPAYIQYSMKKDSDTQNVIQATRLKVVFSNYQEGEVPVNSRYDTNTWFVRRNGQLTLQPDFSAYTITDLTTKDK
jgi:hypothetical protein